MTTTLEQYNSLVHGAVKFIPPSYTLRGKEAFATVCTELRKRKRLGILDRFQIQSICPIEILYSQEQRKSPHLQIIFTKIKEFPGEFLPEDQEELDTFLMGDCQIIDEDNVVYTELNGSIVAFISLDNLI